MSGATCQIGNWLIGGVVMLLSKHNKILIEHFLWIDWYVVMDKKEKAFPCHSNSCNLKQSSNFFFAYWLCWCDVIITKVLVFFLFIYYSCYFWIAYKFESTLETKYLHIVQIFVCYYVYGIISWTKCLACEFKFPCIYIF